MSTKIYIYGCSGCGVSANYVMRVKSNAKDVQVFNTKRDEAKLAEHISYLKRAGMDLSSYQSIVVENNGEQITLLTEWR